MADATVFHVDFNVVIAQWACVVFKGFELGTRCLGSVSFYHGASGKQIDALACRNYLRHPGIMLLRRLLFMHCTVPVVVLKSYY